MNIRRARLEDVFVLAKVHVDAWRAAYRGLVPDSFLNGFTCAKRETTFREMLTSDSGATCVAEERGAIRGFFIVGACRDSDVDANLVGEIWGIYIAPLHWRKGIGRRLAVKAQEALEFEAYREATLWVLEQNEPARRFYEALGYRPDGARKQLNFGKPLTAVRYRKALAGEEGGAGGRS